MESRARILGHSAHATLVALPIGLLVGSVIFDLARLISGREQWGFISYWLIVAGLISGLLAAIFGYVDYRAIPDSTRAKRVGLVHGLGNLVMILMFAASLWLRREVIQDPPVFAYILSFAGIVLATVTAWLGGELVERLGVGVHDNAGLDAPSSLKTDIAGKPDLSQSGVIRG